MNTKIQVLLLLLCISAASCRLSNDQLLEKGNRLSRKGKFEEAIKVYSSLIKRSFKLQKPYYNRGLAYTELKQYDKALQDFNTIMQRHRQGDFIINYNADLPFADEETRFQVQYEDALYQRAIVKYEMDSLLSSFDDFRWLIAQVYEEKSNCLLWLGDIYLRYGKNAKACASFEEALLCAKTDDEKKEANQMIEGNCKEKKVK